jgi:hypothetical protein
MPSSVEPDRIAGEESCMNISRIVAIGLVVLGALGLWYSMTRNRSITAPDSIGTYPRASVVVVTLDTTRADKLGCYGAPTGLTPFLDEMAEKGIVFEAAQTVAPVTLPAHASMMTGLYPIKHTVRNNGMFVPSRRGRDPCRGLFRGGLCNWGVYFGAGAGETIRSRTGIRYL